MEMHALKCSECDTPIASRHHFKPAFCAGCIETRAFERECRRAERIAQAEREARMRYIAAHPNDLPDEWGL